MPIPMPDSRETIASYKGSKGSTGPLSKFLLNSVSDKNNRLSSEQNTDHYKITSTFRVEGSSLAT